MTVRVFAAFSFVLVLLISGNVRAQEDRPNVVWLVSEDNSKHFLKLFDENGAEAPNIEALAKHGLTFRHAFSNGPVCSVARTTLATGCYGPRIGTQFHRRNVMVPLPGDLRMFPYYLREAGYYTSNNRKKDYNAVEGQGVWDESSNNASWRNREEGQPFFHMQSFGISHESSLHFGEDVFRSTKTNTDPESVFVAPNHPPTELFKYTYARYHDKIQEIDRAIGNVVSMLEEDGLLEDTFIFYFGDHGGVLPGSKGYAYEVGLHVPLVIRVPENHQDLSAFELGSDVDGFVNFVDFGPSVLRLAGLAVPDEMDGKPFLGSFLTDTEVNTRDEAFGYADRFDEKYDLVRTLRKGNLKYMRSFQPFLVDGLQNNYRYRNLAYQEWRNLFEAGKLNADQSLFFQSRDPEALYDLESDPYELNNLANDHDYVDALVEMRAALFGKMIEIRDLSMFPESVLVAEAFDNPVKFGETNADRLRILLETSNLSLASFEEAKDDLRGALMSEDPWIRYWALTACTSHPESNDEFRALLARIAAEDSVRLVRVQAVVNLAILGAVNPREQILTELRETRDGVEAALILNSIVLLRDGEKRYEIPVAAGDVHADARKADNVKRRLEYLVPTE